MKRTQAFSPEAQSKRKDDDTVAGANAQLSSRLTESYWKEKAMSLQDPFPVEKEGAVAPTAVAAAAAAAVGMKPYGEGDDANGLDRNQTRTNPALAGKTITSILQRTKPHCPKAQAWMQAQKISDEGRARMAYRAMHELPARVNSKQHERMEKAVAAKLAQKVREMRAQTQAGSESQGHGQGRAEGKAEGGSQDQGQDEVLSPQERVRRAHVRLQKALGLER